MYHLQYTAQMMQAFIDAGKRSELMPYPPKTSMAHAAQTPVHRIERNSERELLGRP